MKLPKDLQHFPRPTLLVAVDERQCRFFLAHHDELTELPSLYATPQPQKKRPRMLVRRGGGKNAAYGGSSKKNIPFGHAFLNLCCAQTNYHLVRQGLSRCYLVTPVTVVSPVRKKTQHMAVRPTVISGDVVHTTALDVADYIVRHGIIPL